MAILTLIYISIGFCIFIFFLILGIRYEIQSNLKAIEVDFLNQASA